MKPLSMVNVMCHRILVMIGVIWRSGRKRRVVVGYPTSSSLGLRKQVAMKCDLLLLSCCVLSLWSWCCFCSMLWHCWLDVMRAIHPACRSLFYQSSLISCGKPDHPMENLTIPWKSGRMSQLSRSWEAFVPADICGSFSCRCFAVDWCCHCPAGVDLVSGRSSSSWRAPNWNTIVDLPPDWVNTIVSQLYISINSPRPGGTEAPSRSPPISWWLERCTDSSVMVLLGIWMCHVPKEAEPSCFKWYLKLDGCWQSPWQKHW